MKLTGYEAREGAKRMTAMGMGKYVAIRYPDNDQWAIVRDEALMGIKANRPNVEIHKEAQND